MGREIFYCHSCGNRILEDDLRKGRALVFLDKVYCQDCKGQAFEQLNAAGGGGAAPAAQAPAPAEPAATPAKGQPGTRPTRIRGGSGSSAGLKAVNPPSKVRPPGSSPQVQVPREAPPAPKSKLPLLIGSIVGFVALAAVLVAMMMKDGATAKPTTSSKPAVSVPVDPVFVAIKAFDDFMASKPPPGAEAIVAQCEKIEPVVKGTPHAERIARIKRRYKDELEKLQGSRAFDEAFAKAKAKAEADLGTYAKYGEITAELSNLYSTAGMDYPDKLQAVKDLRDKYSGPYEAEATKKAEEVGSVAGRLANEEHRYADAVKYVDENFPEKLRQSAAWKSLKSQRDRWARDAEDGPPIEPSKAPSSWKEYYERAQEEIQNKDYRAALDDYLAGVKLLPDLSKLSAEDRTQAILGKYNIACIYFVNATSASGDAKKKANDSGFEWLNKAGADGLMGVSTPGPDKKPVKMADWMAKDSDLDAIRKDPRYDEFMKKYKK